ncbi:MAG: phosphatase RsbU N-terminal domain-containing protein [Pseudohongiella sp.]|uniref:phosphatase RsbU N-terminal domain-containing protein n=1 Tax=Pseudohongiella sp. TaxID=1979412 RepID=UPI0034A02005
MQTLTELRGQNHYQALLNSYFNTKDEDGLTVAYDIGRDKLRNGVGLLDLTETHQLALNELILAAGHSRSERQSINSAASNFLREVLSPFEVARLSNRESNDALVKLYDVFENEAKRIAHRLHDDSAQMLAVVYLELAEIAKNSDPDTSTRIQGVFGLLDEICAQLRNLSHELRPIVLDQLGLMPALKLLTDGVQSRSSLTIDLSGDAGGRINPAVETVIYRTVQEALNNVCRHANASYAEVHVWRDHDSIYCSISDKGDGFRPSRNKTECSSGLGLIGIKERARALGGRCEILSKPGLGTTLQVAIPL